MAAAVRCAFPDKGATGEVGAPYLDAVEQILDLGDGLRDALDPKLRSLRAV